MEPKKPLLRGHFHQSMFFITLGACSLLIAQCENAKQLASSIIYSIGLLSMFGISALYHRINWSPDTRAILRKLDHSGIFIMIAGSFTPITMFALSSSSGMFLLKTIWVVTLLGVLKSVLFAHLNKKINMLLYLIAGYLIMPYVSEIGENVGSVNVWLLVAGGIVYSVGALSYGFKFPKLSPRVFGYHELFHVFVSIAAIIHFIAIYSIILH
ncbi:MAG: hypothetical protein CME64_10940 [Halobacteriovoraceae bacterium]|nr:hypothetical protein [Halobacteriovoraceae bacterium]|tara:strand:+ start:116635 stop:117270 length:636 start_codon:yes stop_codon:yes gene_type:complete